MVNITFKNVGQGDSIIIEWKEGSLNRIGIIDCNQVSEEYNPVIDHIIQNNVREIEFLFLSHPHRDHYSGFLNLIEHCAKNKIIIQRFIHTASISIEYLMAASRSISDKKELLKLYKLLMRMRDDGSLIMNTVDDNPDTIKSLAGGFKLQFLAPSSLEIEKYIRGVKFPFDEENSTSEPNGNWLCSIIKIYNENTSVILTSDVESQVLGRLNKKKGRLKEQKSILVQIPHHGSRRNFNKSFWTGLRKFSKTYSVISVGKNGYGHPSEEVVSFFNNHPDYILERTDYNNLVNKRTINVSGILDLVSNKIETSLRSQQMTKSDLSYKITNNNCVKI